MSIVFITYSHNQHELYFTSHNFIMSDVTDNASHCLIELTNHIDLSEIQTWDAQLGISSGCSLRIHHCHHFWLTLPKVCSAPRY